MSTETGNTEKQSQIEAVAALDIGQLRRAARLLGVTSEKTWTKEMYVEAIQAKQREDEGIRAVFDLNIGPAPGHSRILIHRDPSPGNPNSPVFVAVNGRGIYIPRGAEFDIPNPHVEALRNAVVLVKEEVTASSSENPGGVFKEQPRTSYPYQVLASTPGPFINTNDGRHIKYAKRKAFLDAYGSWPTDGELKEFGKQEMNSRFNPAK